MPFSLLAVKTSLLLFILLSVRIFAADSPEIVHREVPFGKSINLQEFGGPNIEVSVRTREMSYVSADIIDHTQVVPVARTNIQGVTVNNFSNTATVRGTNQVLLLPSRVSRRVEKKNGTRIPGINSDLFLLFEHRETGLKIYFFDAISRMNHDSVVISVPKPPAK